MSKVNFYDIYIQFNDDIMLDPFFYVNYKDKSASYNFKICIYSQGPTTPGKLLGTPSSA